MSARPGWSSAQGIRQLALRRAAASALTFTPAGTRLNIDGTVCFATTSVCGKPGDGSEVGAKPPVFHVPLGIDYTIPGEIPIYLKLQTAFEVKLG